MINGQHGALGPNFSMRKRRSKINVPVGIISKKILQIFLTGVLPNNKFNILFHCKSSVDRLASLKRV